MMTREFEPSPIEIKFREAWNEIGNPYPLIEQYEILGGKFRPDFVHLETMSAIELDGKEFHTGQENWERDHIRQRTLEGLGWRFTRFAGTQVHNDAKRCALVAQDFIARGIAVREQERLRVQAQQNVKVRQLVRPPVTVSRPAPLPGNSAVYSQTAAQQHPASANKKIITPGNGREVKELQNRLNFQSLFWGLFAVLLIVAGITGGIGFIQPWFYILIFMGVGMLFWRFQN